MDALCNPNDLHFQPTSLHCLNVKCHKKEISITFLMFWYCAIPNARASVHVMIITAEEFMWLKHPVGHGYSMNYTNLPEFWLG